MTENEAKGSEESSEGGSDDRQHLSTTVKDGTKKALKQGTGPMGVQIDDLVEKEKEQMDYHYINTNAKHLDGDGSRIYSHGIVATYGPNKFGKKLTDIEPGDGIISYVSGSHVDYEGGAKAFGIALAPYDGKTATGSDRIYPDQEDNEYHVPVRWLAVLPDNRTVTPEEKRQIVGKAPTGTKIRVSDSKLKLQTRLLAQVILGRAGLPLVE
ncbi:hypothetical protein [Halorientalis regularis]|uniref:hypothetical protein n=1 Tax=Halorientalis regularis TaxID=660518 RepID=UPI00111465EC|nr:hypothetical protein [Halorientalis regularis]